MQEIDYRVNAKVDTKQFIDIIRRSGLRRPIDDATRIQRMIDQANLTVTAWDNDKLIGIARSLTDFSYCCYLSDLAVDKEYQRAGIGKELVRRIRQEAGEETSLILLAAPEAMEYYPKIGFEKLENAFIIRRKK